MGEPIETAAEAIAYLAEAQGVRSINKLPGCHECQVDAAWWFAVNGHATPKLHSRSTIPLDPFCCYVEFNGWPAGVFRIGGHGEFAHGAAANEDTFIAACVAAAKRVSGNAS
jgi:hypothetical protein